MSPKFLKIPENSITGIKTHETRFIRKAASSVIHPSIIPTEHPTIFIRNIVKRKINQLDQVIVKPT